MHMCKIIIVKVHSTIKPKVSSVRLCVYTQFIRCINGFRLAKAEGIGEIYFPCNKNVEGK